MQLIGKHLCNIIYMDIENYNVPDNTKVAVTVYRAIQEKSRNELENQRPSFTIKRVPGPVSLLMLFQAFIKDTHTI